MMIKSREQTAAFIREQFNANYQKPAIPDEGTGEIWTFHYGLCELRALMDFIYGGEPTTEAQKVSRYET